MRTSPINVVDPTDLAANDRQRLQHAAEDASATGKLNLDSLPAPVRDQLLFALEAYARGESVAAIAAGGPDGSVAGKKTATVFG